MRPALGIVLTAALSACGGDQSKTSRPVASADTGSRSDDSLDAYEQGVARLKAGESEAAVQAFRRAVELDGDNHAAWYQLGVSDERHRRCARAAKSLARAARLRPKNPVYAHHLGRSLLESGAASKARAALEASLALEPGQYRTHFFLGRARERLGDFRGAARAWTEAARLEPCFVPPFEHLAQLYEAWSFGARALVVVDRGLRCANPMESRSRWRLHAVCARVREQQGESESALSCYDRAIGERRKASLLFRRGLLLYRLGYHQRAGSDLREFLRTSGRSSWNARVARQILGKLR